MTLDLPEPNETRLSKSPLELVVCQIRFENHPQISDGSIASKIHDSLGGSEGPYQRLSPIENQSVEIAVGPDASPRLQSQDVRVWQMAAADDSWIVSLAPDHISLETRAYTTWADSFQPRLGALLDAFCDQVQPTTSQRIGLRYVDRIKEFSFESAQEWEGLIDPTLLGPVLHPGFGRNIQHSQQIVLLNLEKESKCLFRHGVLPPENGRVDYFLDFDLFEEGGSRFDKAALISTATQLNGFALQLFQASVLEPLLERLR